MTMLWVGLAILAAFGSFCGYLTWQLTGRLRSVVSGIAVGGLCVRRYRTEGSDGGSTWHHVYGFTTVDGQYVEFEEDALFMEQGQAVTVRYRPGNPARSATVMGSGGAWSPLFGHLFGILIAGAFTLLGILFVCLSFDA